MFQKNVATIKAPRNKFKINRRVKTSVSVGTLYPIGVQEIYPGDTFNVDTTFVARLTSSYLRPVCDDLFADIYYFYVPSRLCYDRWAEIFGENKQTAWAQPEAVSAPTFPERFPCYSKSVSDYLGIPVGDIPKGLNILPYRAFALIYDEWFRDQNLIDPMLVHTGEWNSDEIPNDEAWSPANYMGKLPKVAKFHDVFTSALPNTQKSLSPVQVPLAGFVPLTVHPEDWYLSDLGGTLKVGTNIMSQPIEFGGQGEAGTGRKTVVAVPSAGLGSSTGSILSTNAGIELANAGVLSVPDLRYAFQLQRILERSARSGTRMTEYLLSAFGVSAPDARLQRPEYLGGKRFPLSVQQVAQTTRGAEDYTELGQLGAFSLTNGRCGYSKGFVEHGFVITVLCLRQRHSYSQGIEKFWQRSDRFSYYDPAFAHISEIPVYKSELYAKGMPEMKSEIFGYQEAWYDLRNAMDMVTGEMRSDAENSLDIWHFADDYSSAPYLTKKFIEETPEYVDRTIAVPSTSLDQFIFDIYHQQTAVRRLPRYSTPGLIDHY